MRIKRKKLLFLASIIFVLGFIFGQVVPSTLDFNTRNLGRLIPGIDVNLQTAKVTRVIDGDTVELENGEHVRYIGMDTPETVDPRKTVECFGKEAASKNKELVEGKTVRLEKDVSDKDRYGRLLRYVYVASSSGELFVNLELVKQGFAHSYTYPPDVKYQEEILEAERLAREDKLGLWETCPPTSSLR